MNRRLARILLGVLACCGILLFAAGAESRTVIDLDGVWNFATDPENRGETDQWYRPDAQWPKMPLPGYAATADGKIRVPGIWDNQGYGTENDKVRHNFVGKGWYRREVTIPADWSGRRTFLVVTGASRYTKAWVNGQFLGEHIGFLSPFEYEVTQHVAPGQAATITLQVDSKQRWAIDAMYGTCSLADFVDVPWGGIWGHVRLESRADAWLSDPFIQPNLHDSSCSASVTLNGKADQPDGVKLEVLDENGQLVTETTTKLTPPIASGQTVVVRAALPNARLWTPDHPHLYRARLNLMKHGWTVDTIETRFGMRQFTADGYHLLLNGKRIMLCGYGDDHIYPEQMAMPSDKELHLARLRKIKSYGFNHVRHHSTMMPPEYYDACDEVGMIATAEFPIAYRKFLPGTGEFWQSQVPPGTDPTPAVETYKREWAAAIQRYRNHPSILIWVMGNEIWEGVPLRYDFQRIARRYDPSRFFSDSDGLFLINRPLTDSRDRDTLDMYFLQFDEFINPINHPEKFKTPPPLKPSLSHEAGNFVTFTRPDLIDQFKNNFKPFWLTASKAKLKQLGLSDEADTWAEKSERLYLLLHKYNLETLRKSPYLSGYHWWLFQDYWTSSNGIVDHYFRPKSIRKEEVLKFNGPVVLLEDGLERTYRGKEPLDVKLRISNFSPGPIEGDATWTVTAVGKNIAQGQLRMAAVAQGELGDVGRLRVELPEVTEPVRLHIRVELTAGAKHYSNDWDTRLFPRTIAPRAVSAPIFGDEATVGQYKAWGVKPIPAEGALSDSAVYVTGSLDPRVIDAMAHGAGVVLLGSASPRLEPRPAVFKTSWWKAGESTRANDCGTLVYDHPATRAVAPDGWCDAGWVDLIEGGKKYFLEKMPARPNVIVRALPSLLLVEDQALMFEVGVGKGTLLVSGLNHAKAAGRPENDWIVARLIERAAESPQLKARWPVSFLLGTEAPSKQ